MVFDNLRSASPSELQVRSGSKRGSLTLSQRLRSTFINGHLKTEQVGPFPYADMFAIVQQRLLH